MMRKRFFGLLAALAAAFIFMPLFITNVSADTGHNHDGWTAWAASEHSGKLPTTEGNYYLTEDVTLSGSWSVPTGDTKLCLNGHVIKLGTPTSSTYNVINIGANKTLSLYDCGSDAHYFLYSTTKEWTYIEAPTDEQISGAISKDSITDTTVSDSVICLSGGAIIGTEYSNIEISGIFNLYGGNLVGNIGSKSYWTAPIVISDNGTCNIYEGNIIGNTGVYGGIVVSSSYLNMYGGTISYNIMQGGGGIYAKSENGLIRMEGGTISHNKATLYDGGGVATSCEFIMTGGTIAYNESAKSGGGIYLSQYSLLKMSGGTITGNTSANKGGGVYLWGNSEFDKVVFVGGTAQITGNKKVVNNVAIENNCEIDEYKCIIIGTGTEGNGVDVPVTGTSGMKIGVTKSYWYTTHDKAIINAQPGYMECFIPDDNSIIRFMDNDTSEDASDDYFECAQLFNITNASKVEDKDSNHGYVTVDKSQACEDDVVTVTIYPDTDYRLKKNGLKVLYSTSHEVDLIQDATNPMKYTFTMPKYNVTVSAEFEAIHTLTNQTPVESKDTNHGYLTVDTAKAFANETITVIVYPNTGYRLKNGGLKIQPETGYPVASTQDTANPAKYTFTMPKYNVTVSAEFEALPTKVYLCNGESVINNPTAFPANPTFGSYVFAGWYDAEIGGNQITSFVPGTDYYAHWKLSSTDEHFILALEKGISIGKDNGTGKNILVKNGGDPLNADILNEKYGISFNPDTNTLSLNDAAVISYSSETQTSSLYIAATEPVTIDVTGDCLLGGKSDGESLSYYGIKANGGDVAVAGDGKLTINCKSNSSCGIYTWSTSGDISISVGELDINGAYTALTTKYDDETEISITGSKVVINNSNTTLTGYNLNIVNSELTVSNVANMVFSNHGTTTILGSTLTLQAPTGIHYDDIFVIDNSTIAFDLPDSVPTFAGRGIYVLKGSPVIYDSPSDKATFSIAIDGSYWHPTIDLKDYTAPEGGAKMLLKCDEELGSDLAEYGPITVVTNVGTGANASKMPIISADCEGGYLGFAAGTAGATDIALKPAKIGIKLTGEDGNQKLEANFNEEIEGMSYQWLEAETTEGSAKEKGITVLTEVNEVTSEEDIKSFGDQVSYYICAQYCGVSHFSTCNADGSYTGVSEIPSEITAILLNYVGLSGVDLYIPMVLVTQKNFDLDNIADDTDLMPLMMGKDKFNISIKTTGDVNKIVLFNMLGGNIVELAPDGDTFTGTVPMGFYLVFMATTGDIPTISEFKAEVVPVKDICAISKPTENMPESEYGANMQNSFFEILGLDPSSEASILSVENNGVYTDPMLASDDLIGMFTNMTGYQAAAGEKLYIPMYLITMRGFDFDTVTEDDLLPLMMGDGGTGDLSLKVQNADKVLLLNFISFEIVELIDENGDSTFEDNIPSGFYMMILSSKDAETPIISDIDFSASAAPTTVKIDESSITPISGKTGTNMDYNLTIAGKAYGCRISIPQNGCIVPQSLMTQFILSDYVADGPVITAESDGFTYGASRKTGYKNVTVTDDLYTEAQLTKTYYRDNGTGASPRWELLDGVPTDAGSYKVILAVPESEGIGNVSTEVSFTISKAEASLTAPTAKNLTENGQTQALVTAGATNDGEIQYALGDNASTAPASGWSSNVPTRTSAGKYYVWYKVTGDANHNDTAPVCIAVEIDSKNDPIDPVDPDDEDPAADPDADQPDDAEVDGDDIVPDKKDVLIIEDNLSEESNTEEIVATIESALAENNTKDIVLKADEKTVTEQGIENKMYADAATETITEVTKDSDSKTVILAEDIMETLAKAENIDSLTVMTSVADVEFDAKAIESINEQSDGDIKLVVTLVKEEIAINEGENNKVYFEVSLIKDDGTEITTFEGGSIKITLPIPKASQNEEVVVVYSDGKGHYTPVNGTVNADGTFTFVTPHLSEYILMTQREADSLYNYIYDFGTLKMHSGDITDDTIVLEWDRYEDADGYIIYGNFCNCDGKTYKVKKLATIKDASITEYTIKGLEKGTRYKFRVKAFKIVNGKKYVTVKSYYAHLATSGGKQKVTSEISISQEGMKKNNALTLKCGKDYDISATRFTDTGKEVQHFYIRYESSNTSVATVSKDGKITAVGKGKCTVLVIAENGVYEELAVTVK